MTADEKLDKKDRVTLQSIVRPIIAGADKDAPISPSWVATRALKGIERETLNLAAHYAFREVARSILREKSSPISIGSRAEITKQLDLPGFELLHDKYPKPDGSGYVFIENMTFDEAEWNADQLEQLGRAALRHAQQLRRWISMRRKAS